MFKSTAGKTLRNLAVGTTFFYGGGVALALNNTAFNEVFTDNIPFADEAVDFVESLVNSSKSRDYNIQNFKQKFGDLEKTLTIPKSGIFSQKIDSVKQEVEKAKDSVTSVLTSKPAFKLPTIDLTTSDPALSKAVTEFNAFITSINNAEVSPATSFDSLKSIFADLDSTLKTLQSKADEVYNKKITEAIAKKENELIQSFTVDYNAQIAQIQKQHEAQVANEIKIARQAIEQHYDNAVKIQAVRAKEEFTKQVKKAIEEERESKYAQFAELDKKLSALQHIVLKIDDHLNNSEHKVKLQFSLNKLKSKLASDSNENLTAEFAELKSIAQESKNDVILSAIDAVDGIAAKQGLLTQAQLITRFNLLVPELRSAALLPPNAGVLGHFAAKVFSTLLISKEGHAEGRDIESVIARVENNLVRNRLDDAVEEVANLKGWSRKLADDWLVESRKRLEVEFLVKLIDLESRTLF